MGASDVLFGVQEEPFVVLAPEDVATPTENLPGQIDRHPAYKTAALGRSFPQASPFAASA